MPDSTPWVLMARTRRELKDAIVSECDVASSDATVGLSKRDIASFVAECWREAHKPKPAFLPYCLPCKERGQTSYSYGVFCSVATRQEYLAFDERTD